MIKEEDKQYFNNPDYSPALEKFFAPEIYASQNEVVNFQGAKGILNSDVVNRVYPYSNENLHHVFKSLGVCNKVLTIGSSGDQALQALYNGAKDVTVVDANLFSKYWIDYKIAAIKNLSFYEFNEALNTKAGLRFMAFENDIFSQIFHDLDEDSATFWGMLFQDGVESYEVYYKMLERNDVDWEYYPCSFYASKEDYEKLQQILRQGDYSLKVENAEFTEFPDVFKDRYDTIVLSNVCKYVDGSKYKDTIRKLYTNNLVDGGSMQLHYSYHGDMEMNNILENFKKELPEIDVQLKKHGEQACFVTTKPKVMEDDCFSM